MNVIEEKNIEKENVAEKDKKLFTKERIFIIVSSIIFLVCFIYIGFWFYQTKQDEEQSAELEKQILLEIQDENPNETR